MHFKVSYLHLCNYRVSRTFDSFEAAEEFIAINAMVCKLPGLIRHYIPTTGIDHWLAGVRS